MAINHFNHFEIEKFFMLVVLLVLQRIMSVLGNRFGVDHDFGVFDFEFGFGVGDAESEFFLWT